MPPIARGQTWLFQPLPVSTVPNTGRNQSDSGYRALDEEECSKFHTVIMLSNFINLIKTIIEMNEFYNFLATSALKNYFLNINT